MEEVMVAMLQVVPGDNPRDSGWSSESEGENSYFGGLCSIISCWIPVPGSTPRSLGISRAKASFPRNCKRKTAWVQSSPSPCTWDFNLWYGLGRRHVHFLTIPPLQDNSLKVLTTRPRKKSVSVLAPTMTVLHQDIMHCNAIPSRVIPAYCANARKWIQIGYAMSQQCQRYYNCIVKRAKIRCGTRNKPTWFQSKSIATTMNPFRTSSNMCFLCFPPRHVAGSN